MGMVIKVKTVLIGAGSDLGVHVDGAHLGPTKLINDLNDFYKGEVINLVQEKTIIKSKEKLDLRKNEKEIEKFNTTLYNAIDEKIKDAYFPILLGGDHSVAVASALASANNNGNIGIIWFDAHTDYHTFDTTISGNIHGLPLAAITGYKNEELRTFHKGKTINPKNAVIVGARSVDAPEYINLKDAGVSIFTTEDLKEQGIDTIVEKSFAIATNGTNKTHISYDLDLIDPTVAPGVSVPAVNGINKEEAKKINDLILEHIDQVVSYDLVEYNPIRDIDNKTENIALDILKDVISKIENSK